MQPPPPTRDDAVLLVTRALAVFIIPFLVVAAILLFVWPNDTDRTFAWTIKPSMTPMMLAAAYIGGIYYFAGVTFARRWHAIKLGFLPVTFFASFLGLATILHWDRFNHSHISFFAWTALYFATPFLVVAVWLINRRHDPGQPAADEIIVPGLVRLVIGAVGAVTLLVSLFLFLVPSVMVSIWPWILTPLTARVLGAMFALPGIVGLGIALEPRWSAARLILQSQAFSILFILIAAARAYRDFNPANLLTYVFVLGLLGFLVMIAMLFIGMELFKPKRSAT